MVTSKGKPVKARWGSAQNALLSDLFSDGSIDVEKVKDIEYVDQFYCDDYPEFMLVSQRIKVVVFGQVQ